MILLLNGPINAGKTTVGRELGARLERAAHVEVDDLHGFLVDVPLAEAVPISLENAVSVAANLAERGFDVVLTYPLSESDFEYVSTHLSHLDTEVYAVTLSPPLAVAQCDRGERELDDWERERIAEMYERGVHRPSFGVRLDNADQSPAETAAEIQRLIEGGADPAVAAGERLEPVAYRNEWVED
jgi:chloramphenicol 3-O-phosphotransferase